MAMPKTFEDFCQPSSYTGPYSQRQAQALLDESDGPDFPKLRRRIEDALRKTATYEDLLAIAKILNVKTI